MELIQKRNIFGQKITFIKNDLIGKKIFNHGAYDITGLYLIKKILLCMKDPISMDIGANIGNHTLLISKYSKTLVSFEPQPAIFSILEKNIIDNNIDNTHAYKFGISNWSGFANMQILDSENSGATSFSTNNATGNIISCELRHGDTEVKRIGLNRIDFIKIDVEGLEPQVIDGLKETIVSDKPIILIEWNNIDTKNGFAEKSLFETIFAGYFIYSVTSNYEKPAAGESRLQKLKRKFIRKFLKPKIKLEQFEPSRDYGNIVLVPQHKNDSIKSAFNL